MTTTLTNPGISIIPEIRAPDHPVLSNCDLVAHIFSYLNTVRYRPTLESEASVFARALITSLPRDCQPNSRAKEIQARKIEVLTSWRLSLQNALFLDTKQLSQAQLLDFQLEKLERGSSFISPHPVDCSIYKRPQLLPYTLRHYPQCNVLTLQGRGFFDWDLVPQFSHLQELMLCDLINFPFRGFQWTLPLLKKFSFFDFDDLPTLAFLDAPQLEEIVLDHSGYERGSVLPAAVLLDFARFPLQTLDIDGYYTPGPLFFPPLPALRDLDIQHGPFEDLPFSAPLPALHTLDCSIQMGSWGRLQHVPNLTSLTVDSSEISPDDLSRLSLVPHLTNFCLETEEEITSEHIQHLPPLLKSFKLCSQHNRDASQDTRNLIELLKRCSSLTTLECDFIQSADYDLTDFPDHPSLQTLSLSSFTLASPDQLQQLLCLFPNLANLKVSIKANSEPEALPYVEVIKRHTLTNFALTFEVKNEKGLPSYVTLTGDPIYGKKPILPQLLPLPPPSSSQPNNPMDE